MASSPQANSSLSDATKKLFFRAIGDGQLSEIRALLTEYPALLNAQDTMGWSPLHYLFYSVSGPDEAAGVPDRFLQCAALFMDLGADCRLQNVLGTTPLFYAARRNASSGSEALKMLIPYLTPSDLMFQDHEGNTALHLVADDGHMVSARLLVEAGASLEIKNHIDFTPLEMALSNFRVEMAEYLTGAELALKERTALTKVLSDQSLMTPETTSASAVIAPQKPTLKTL